MSEFIIPEQVTLVFDPLKVTDKEMTELIADPVAWLLWRCWRPKHLTNQSFNAECMDVARRIATREPKDEESLARCFPQFTNGGNFMRGDVARFVPEFLPYLLGQKQLTTTVTLPPK